MNDTPRKPGPGEHPPYQTDALLNAWLSQRPTNSSDPAMIRVDAIAIADASCGVIPQASLILRHEQGRITIVFAGPTRDIPSQLDRPDMPLLTLHDQIVMPALVNAHTHLDLSHIGPQTHLPEDGFVGWVDMIRACRAADDDEIAQCVRLGIQKTLAGGVIAVGDIAGAPAGRLCDVPAKSLAASPLFGVSYLEFFGIGTTAASAIQRVRAYLQSQAPQTQSELEGSNIALGLQPHAPNTVDLSVYRWVTQAAVANRMPLCTHLAETIEERMFIADGIGPQRAMLERFGIWDDSILESIARGNHPIEHLRPVLERAPYLVAHVNDADDAGIELLAQTGTSVAYCPRASRYFGAESHFGPHRYRDMLQAGVNVCLGTDSIVNLDTHDRISTLDDIRLLHATDRHTPQFLLAMGTTNGAIALGLDPERFRIGTGCSPIGLIALRIHGDQSVDIWESAMRQTNAPHWLFLE